MLTAQSFTCCTHNCKLQAVELRQKVYDIANAFFGLPDSNTNIVISDANQYLFDMEDNNTDIIFADMYGAIKMNPFQMQTAFVHQVYKILTKKGWLVINFHELPSLDSDFFEALFHSFSEIFICQTTNKKNTILFASKKPLNVPLSYFELPVALLEKRLEVKITTLFKRLTQLHQH